MYVSDAIMKHIEHIKKTQKDEHNDTLTNKQVVEYTFYEVCICIGVVSFYLLGRPLEN